MENFPMRIARSHEIRSESQKPARVRKDLAEFRVMIATAKTGAGSVLVRSRLCRQLPSVAVLQVAETCKSPPGPGRVSC